MHHFEYKAGLLHAEDVPLKKIAQKVGTPAYVYSHATLTRHFKVFDQPFSELDHITCFSVKACSNLAILRLFATLGAGFDVVSGGELFRARQAGADPKRIVFSGVGKTEAEIRYALEEGILLFNVESEQELDQINRVAGGMNRKAKVAMRVNPDISAETHPYVATGLKQHKFGIDIKGSIELYHRASRMKNIEVAGVDCHIGSQLTRTAPFVDALTRMVELVEELRESGLDITYLDVGGGLGITYLDEEPPLPREYAREILLVAKDLECTLILEPGRVIAGNAGILLTRVLFVKEGSDKKFIIVDAGMNDLLRPSLYGAYHDILPVDEKKTEPGMVADVVGPLCESGDFLARGRRMPITQPGELLAVMSAGAYGFVMASNYNSRPLPAEVLVKGTRFFIIRERESYQDLTSHEKIPDFLSR
jgi:diaminopimelate decarboxylase